WLATVQLAGDWWSKVGFAMAIKHSIRLKWSETILAHAILNRSLARQFMRLKFIPPIEPELVDTRPSGATGFTRSNSTGIALSSSWMKMASAC
ncbi:MULTISPECIES: hypothetical protein, partial [unclassified Mesorhizobium]|uniref:hypothetical protein n=1 Tax=unclassified Mesorhizobium TaxID=325217 RepID=UPI001FDF9DD3